MSNLLLQPDLSGDGPIHDVTPASAGWSHVGFGLHDLAAGRSVGSDGTVDEICLVLLSGSVRIIAGDLDTGMLQGRASVFDKVAPHAVYVPMKTAWRVEAGSDSELAVCRAPGTEGKLPPRLIGSQNMPLETRGTGSNVRHVCNILPETEPADSLLVVEVITPAGNWSSYPPHKHDTDNLPEESYLEETYYHRVNPPQGYVLHRVYDDSRELDETMAAEDRTVVLVPRGYHPVGAPHGYESYYLNVMAGPKRIWKFKNDPAHEWMLS
ncbi:MAG: 5-deoxy-glucuronate isomerase [SAR116 cluster bacterium]|nr:5-deoxy-glucuronate isomerase [SAR116 cluster bacterium]MEC8765398.1 5-deoxy-glucuronate isomerase [Pseudomonadota bacterium]